MKFGMRERLREKQEASGMTYEDDSYEVYMRHKKANTINAVDDEKLSRIKDRGYYQYNFKVNGFAMRDSDKAQGFKELYEYIKSKPGLDKKLGFNEHDMERLSKGEETRHLSWNSFDQPKGIIQLVQIAGLDD